MKPGDRRKNGDRVTKRLLHPQRQRQQWQMIREEEAKPQADPEQHHDDPQAYVTRYLREKWPRYAANDQTTFGRRICLIRVTTESLPSMDELRSFGRLGRQEGVQACARLFRLPPFWEEICAGLWVRLRDDEQTRESTSEESTAATSETLPCKTRTPPCGRDRTRDVGEPRVQFHDVDWSGENADNSEYASFWARIREDPVVEPRSPKDTSGIASAWSNFSG